MAPGRPRSRMKRDRREPGRLKIKLAAMLTEILQADYPGIEVDPWDFWMQEGSYRGAHWDLARWGIDPVWRMPEPGTGKRRNLDLRIFSWSTMADCVRWGIELDHDPRDLPHTFDVESKRPHPRKAKIDNEKARPMLTHRPGQRPTPNLSRRTEQIDEQSSTRHE